MVAVITHVLTVVSLVTGQEIVQEVEVIVEMIGEVMGEVDTIETEGMTVIEGMTAIEEAGAIVTATEAEIGIGIETGIETGIEIAMIGILIEGMTEIEIEAIEEDMMIDVTEVDMTIVIDILTVLWRIITTMGISRITPPTIIDHHSVLDRRVVE